MSKDEFLTLKLVLQITKGTIEDGVETYKTQVTVNGITKTLCLIFSPSEIPNKRYKIQVID